MRIQSFLIATALWAAPAFAQAPVAPAPIAVAPVVPVAPATDKPSGMTADGTLSVCSGFQQLSAPVHPRRSSPCRLPARVRSSTRSCCAFPKQGNVSLDRAPDLPLLHA